MSLSKEFDKLEGTIYRVTEIMTTSPPPSLVEANWEYLKTLISVFAGFITAFLAEPVKTYFTDKAKKRNLRRSLYGELLGIYNSLFTFLVSTEERGIHIPFSKVIDTNFDCYKFAKSDPALFYQLKEASIISQTYNNIALLKQEAESGIEIEKSISIVKLIVLQIESFLQYKKLNQRMAVEYCKGLPVENRVKDLFFKRIKAGELRSSPRNHNFN